MPRRILTDAEREQRRQDHWERILHGQQREGQRAGDPEAWREAFRARFGLGATAETGSASEADRYFGLHVGYSRAELRRAFCRKIAEVHPDHGGTVKEARRCIRLYETLLGGL